MDTTSRASQADMSSSPKRNAADSSSKEKKILQGRRQQRHSTEIGSEYYRWWAVRNALGFETNEHIAGLLLDGFHGLLHQLVTLCGGDTYQPTLHTELKLPPESTTMTAAECPDDVAQSPSSSSAASPPGGVENMNGFVEYRNAVSHYCDCLWRMWSLQGSQLQQLDNVSQPVQEFMIRLMGYLRAAKGKSYSLNPKKKRYRSSSVCLRSIEAASVHVKTPKSCLPGVNLESQPSATGPSSSPLGADCVAGTSIDGHQQGIVERGVSCLDSEMGLFKQTRESATKRSVEVKEDPLLVDRNSRAYDADGDQSHCSFFQRQVKFELKEKTDLRMEKEEQLDFQEGRNERKDCQKGKPRKDSQGKKQELEDLQQKEREQRDFQKEGDEETYLRGGREQTDLQNKRKELTKSKEKTAVHGIKKERSGLQREKKEPKGFLRVEALDGPCCTQSKSTVRHDSEVHERRQTNSWPSQKCHQQQLENVAMAQPLNLSQPLNLTQPLNLSRPLNLERPLNLVASAPVAVNKQVAYLGRNVRGVGTWNGSIQPTKRPPQQDSVGETGSQAQQSSQNQELALGKGWDVLGKKQLDLLWNLDSLNNVALSTRDETVTESHKGSASKEFGDFSDGRESCSKSHEELGFLTDTLKMLPCIDDDGDSDLSSLPPLQLSENDSDYTQRHKSQNDLQVNAEFLTMPGKQVQGCQSKSLKTSRSDVPSGTSRAQSLLAATPVPPQKVQESQTNTRFYNEVRINVSNPRQVSDLKSHVLVGSPGFQPIQPAMFSGEKTSPASIGTPVILYPASSFSTGDSSLASLSSLVHNIVYNSYGTIIKPLSVTALSSPAPANPQPQATSSFSRATSDTPQKKSIAAALPVLSSQLSSGRPAIFPFCISHAAVGNLSKTTQTLGFAKSSSDNALPQTAAVASPAVVPTATTQGATDRISCKPQPATITGAIITQHQPPVVNLSSGNTRSERRFSNQVANSEPAQERNADGQSCLHAEFTPTGQAGLSSTLTTNPGNTSETGKKDKDDRLKQHLSKNSQRYSTDQIENQDDLFTSKEDLKPSTKPGVVASDTRNHNKQRATVCDRKTQQGMSESTSTKSKSILNSLLVNKHGDDTTDEHGGGSRYIEDDVKCIPPEQVVCTADITASSFQKSGKEAAVTKDGNQQEDGGLKSNVKKKKRVVNTVSAFEKKCPPASSQKLTQRRGQLVCPVCKEVFLSPMDLLVHRFEHHGFVCRECDSRFLTSARLRQHKETDHPPMLICAQCQFYTFRRAELVQHTWSAHGGRMNDAAPGKDEAVDCGAVDRCLADPSRESEVVAAERTMLVENLSMKKMLQPTKDNVCLDNSGVYGNKPETVVVTRAFNDDSHCRDQGGICGTSLAENQREMSVSESRLPKDLIAADVEKSGSGPVFPSRCQEVSDIVRYNLDSVSDMFAQVSRHCHLDSAEFLNASDHPVSENEEPPLVIDTDFSFTKDDSASTMNEQHGGKMLAEGEREPLGLLRRHTSRTGRKANKLSAKARNSFLGDEDSTSKAVNAQRKVSDVYMKERGKSQNLPAEEGSNRERLIMSINLKRKNSETYDENHSGKQRKRRNSKSIIDSSSGVGVIVRSSGERRNNNEDTFTTKSCLSRNHALSRDMSETSCDMISSSSDNQGKRITASVQIPNISVPADYLSPQYQENARSLQKADPANLAKSEFRNDAVGNSGRLELTVSMAGDALGHNHRNSQPGAALSVSERHVMSSLPPKKRKLKRSSRGNDVSSTVDIQNSLESVEKKVYWIPEVTALEKKSSIGASVGDVKKNHKKDKAKFNVHANQKESISSGSNHTEKVNVYNQDQPVSLVLQGSEEETSLFVGDHQRLKNNESTGTSSLKSPICLKWSMRGQLERVPGRVSQIGCSVAGCEVKCQNKRELRQHITVEHLGKTRKYMCSWPDCSKGFFARTHLSIHMLTHTGEKPVACDICDYRCRQRTALIWHLRKHGVFHKTTKVNNRKNATS